MSEVQKDIKIEVLEHTDTILKIVLYNVPVKIANSLRRSIISLVPTIAIDKVIIFRNDSIMNDDMLAHRLGLIPLKTSLDKIRELEGNNGKVSLVLSVSSEDGVRTVKSGDIVCKDGGVELLSKEIDIVKLAEGESIELEMEAVVGRGKEHAKWSPVTVAVVRGLPVIKIKRGKCGDECEKCVEACPKGVLAEVDGRLRVVDRFKCTVCKLCEKACPDKIRVDIDESSSLLYIESVGQLTVDEIIRASLEELDKKFDELYNAIKVVG